MKRVVRRVVQVAVATVLLVVVAFSLPAQAAGPETALGQICEHVDGGTWSAATMSCDTGSESNVSTAAIEVCENAIGGELERFGIIVPPDTVLFGWSCQLS